MSLRTAQEGRVRHVTLASPGTRNVLTLAMAASLLWELTAADEDPDTGAVLLDADGDVFCGGLDRGTPLPEGVFAFGQRSVKPVVASVRGVALSAGVALLANAHIVIAAQGSSFGLTDLREGHCDAEVLEATARALGHRRTRELALTARIFTIPEAIAWGLVHAAVPAIELEDRAAAVARGLSEANTAAVASILAQLKG